MWWTRFCVSRLNWLDSFCHALRKCELTTSYWFAEELLAKNSTDEEKKKLTTEIFEYKISLLEEILSSFFSKMIRLVNWEYLVDLVEKYYKEQERNCSFWSNSNCIFLTVLVTMFCWDW